MQILLNIKKALLQAMFALLLTTTTCSVAFAESGAEDEGSAVHNEHEEHETNSGHDEHEEEAVKGPHRGRLLNKDGFEVELAIFERGVPPEYRAWAKKDDKRLSPDQWSLSVNLTRLGGKVDHFAFSKQGDFLLGDGVVSEPHSFDVEVTAQHEGQSYEWHFPSHEGRLTISSEMAQKTGVRSAPAGASTIREISHLYGRIMANPQNTSLLKARFPGLIRKVNVGVGDLVKAGQVVAEVEANESLKPYPLRAPISGTVMERFVNPGEVAGSGPLLSIVNHDEVWLDLDLFPRDVQRVKVGQAVSIHLGETKINARIDHLNFGSGRILDATARVVLDNKQSRLPLGLMLEADVTVGQVDAPLVVANGALQSFRDWTVVFIQVGNTYEIRPLELGRSDGLVTEVLEGLNPGDRYVVGNSYLLKADLEKSGASHDH